MKRIITSSALALNAIHYEQRIFSISFKCFLYYCREDFETDPIARGFTIRILPGLVTRHPDKVYEPGAALPNTQYVITTPLVPIYYYGSILMGFKVKTSPGSNDYFATGGFNTTIQVLDSVKQCTCHFHRLFQQSRKLLFPGC
jgi:hypothetical protein